MQGLCPLAKRRLRRDETPAAHSASARCEVDGDGMGAVPDKTRGFPGFDPPGLALMRDSATRPHVSLSTAFSPTLPIYHFLCRDFAKICGWSGGEGRYASSTLGSDKAGDGDMYKATDTPPGLFMF